MMIPDYSAAELAGGMVRAGIARLAGDYPFHARVLERFRPRADPAVGTMGVGLRDGRLELVFAPAFVTGVTADELGGVLLHEVFHVIFGHVTADREKFPDRDARTIAEETTVNEFVREPLPGRPIVLAMFPHLPPGESTAERYRRLAGRVPKKWKAVSAATKGPGSHSPAAGQGAGGPNDPADPAGDERAGADADGDGKGGEGTHGGTAGGGAPDKANKGEATGGDTGVGMAQPARQTGRPTGRRDGGHGDSDSPAGDGNTTGGMKPSARPSPPRHGLVDNHGSWPSTPEQREGFRQGLADLIAEVAADTLVPMEIVKALRGCGIVPGHGRYFVHGDATGELDWRVLLRRYVGLELRVEPRYGRPPRRYPDLAGVVPGRGRAEGDVSVVAVIDTSASMSDPMLEAIAGEMRQLARHHPVRVVECDCVVRRSYRFRGGLADVVGRGGTDFRPPLERAFLRRLRPRPAVVIVFTDGDGPAPDRAPAVPVIWCLTPGGRRPASWGRIVEMDARAKLPGDDDSPGT